MQFKKILIANETSIHTQFNRRRATMPVPQQPQPPVLVNGDARRPDSLTVTWPNAAGALIYNASLTDEDGNTSISSNVSRPLAIGGLMPTKRYSISIQAQNADGVSPFSHPLTTRTRPETPGAPSIIQDAVIPVHLVKWNIATPPGGFAVLRRIGAGTDQVVVPNAPLVDQKVFSSIPSGLTWQYLMRVVLAQPDMPGGENESFWSPASQVTTVEAVTSSPALRRTFGGKIAQRRRY